MKKDTKDAIRSYGQLLNLGFSVVLTILLGLGLGYLLDKHFKTNFLMITMTILFTIIAIVNLFVTLLKVK